MGEPAKDDPPAAGVSAPAVARTRTRWGVRALAYGLLAAIGALVYVATLSSPNGDVRSLAAAVRARDDARQLIYRSGKAFVGFFPGRGYTLTLHVEGYAGFGPARFLILSRLDGAIRGELICPMGTEIDHRFLEPEEFEAYLAASSFDAGPIDRIFEARFAEVAREETTR